MYTYMNCLNILLVGVGPGTNAKKTKSRLRNVDIAASVVGIALRLAGRRVGVPVLEELELLE